MKISKRKIPKLKMSFRISFLKNVMKKKSFFEHVERVLKRLC